MSRLNKTKQNEILLYLDNQHFTLSDFEVKFPDQGDEYVSVTFRHNRKYSFRISEKYPSLYGIGKALQGDVERTAKPWVYEAPGEFKAQQEHSFASFDECIRRIPSWCKNLQTELRAGDLPLDELQEEFGKSFEQQIDEPESCFSPEELQRVYQNLDSLAERIKKMEQEHAITQAQLNELLSGIEGIKGNAATLPKGVWAGLTKNRWISLLKKIATSPEGRKLLLEAAEKFLLGTKG